MALDEYRRKRTFTKTTEPRGKLSFHLKGKRLKGAWVLVRTGSGGGRSAKPQWLLIKRTDPAA